MASQTSKILVSFQAEDSQLAAAFKKLGRQSNTLEKNFTSLSDKGIRRIRNEFNKMAKGSTNSLQAMRAQKNALMGLRDQADVAGLEFKQLTADIAALDARMRTAGAGATGFKSRLKGFAKGAGAIAAGGIFGGPEGAIGGAIGLKVGGPAGAAVGAAIGAQVGMVRQQIAGLAEYSAALGLQRKALRLVINDTEKFNQSQKFLLITSRELAIPQDIITRQFTSLTASVVGAGKSVSDAEKVFQAIAAGIRGTGGNLEDMKAAMRATSQVFSKGKVSAEELRQQLGERLPGAFTLFADSMNKTPAELDKALEQGKVTLDDFMKFAETLFARYGENAKILAKGPEAAGDRLKTVTSELKDAIGKNILPIGAAFQTEFARIAEAIAQSKGTLDAFGIIIKSIGAAALSTFFSLRFMTRSLVDLINIINHIAVGQFDKAFKIAQKGFQETSEQAKKDLKSITDLFKDGSQQPDGAGNQNLNSEINKTNENTNNLKNTSVNAFEAMKLGVQEYMDSIKDMNKQIKDTFVNAFKGMEDALVQFVLTGKLNFRKLAQSILADLARMIVRQQMFNALSGFTSIKNPLSIFRKSPVDQGIADRMTSGRSFIDAALQVDDNATGNAFSRNGIVPYRKGGIVSSPTMFKFGGSNLGIMGEAGPEAILPLQRGKGGKLGVIAQGGGAVNVTVNVDASSSSVEGDEQNANEFGEQIATAVQAVIINEKRVGGLLS